MGDSHVGLQARLMSQALRKLAGTLNRTDTICLFTNQLREKIGVMFGSPEVTPGGRALKFYSSVRLDIRRIETLKEGVEAIGNRIRVKVVKNKVAPPFKQAEFDIMYGTGFSWEGTVIDVATERKVVTKSGSYFSFRDERLGQGRQNATAFLREHPDVTQQILQQIQIEIGPEQIVSARLLPLGEEAPVDAASVAEGGNAEGGNGEPAKAAGSGRGGRRRESAPPTRRRQPTASNSHRTARAAAGKVEVEPTAPVALVPPTPSCGAACRSGGRSTGDGAPLGRELRRAEATAWRPSARYRDPSRRRLEERSGSARDPRRRP
jgi:hypothetical protein